MHDDDFLLPARPLPIALPFTLIGLTGAVIAASFVAVLLRWGPPGLGMAIVLVTPATATLLGVVLGRRLRVRSGDASPQPWGLSLLGWTAAAALLNATPLALYVSARSTYPSFTICTF